MGRTTRIIFASAAIGIAASSVIGAGEPWVYATNHQGHFPDFGDTLIRFHPSDPAGYETIGSLNVANTAFGGLEFDGDGNLWAYASFNSFGGAASGLYSVDLKTGEASVQGTISNQTLSDLAWNPVDQKMYGVYSQGFTTSRLYEVNLQTGAVTIAGQFTGLDPNHNAIGLGIDSQGTFYIFDNMNKKMYASDAQLNLTLIYGPTELTCEGCEQAVGSQGIGIDWSRDNQGYHGAVGQGEHPNFYGNLNTFALDGSSYVWGPEFGEPLGDGPLFPPNVQPGDIAVQPGDDKPVIPGDLNGDGLVDAEDLFILLAAWGACADPDDCPADLDGNGEVDAEDLFILLANWG